MTRIFLAGTLALGVALTGVLAQQPQPKSQPELDAIKAMLSAQTADARIAAAENLLTKFSDTQFKPVALYFEAMSYQQKGDYDRSVVFGEQTLKADPKYYQAMLMLASEIAGHIKEFDLDKADKIAQVNKYANDALAVIKDAPKPNPTLSDDQWAEAKKDMFSQAHAAMGMAAQVDKKYDVAEREYKTALESGAVPDPATMVRLGRCYSEEGKYDDAVAQFDKVMAISDVNPTVRQVAQAERVRTIQKKNGGAAAPKPDATKTDAPKPPETPKP